MAVRACSSRINLIHLSLLEELVTKGQLESQAGHSWDAHTGGIGEVPDEQCSGGCKELES